MLSQYPGTVLGAVVGIALGFVAWSIDEYRWRRRPQKHNQSLSAPRVPPSPWWRRFRSKQYRLRWFHAEPPRNTVQAGKNLEGGSHAE